MKSHIPEMAIAWLLRDKRISSILIGASKVSQLKDNIDALKHLDFTSAELENINDILK